MFNIGLLFERARWENGREVLARETISAAIDLAERFPEIVDMDASPDRLYTPATLREVIDLHERQGLSLIAPSARAHADAAVNVGITFDEESRAAGVGDCTPLPADIDFDGTESWILVVDSATTIPFTATTAEASSGARRLSIDEGRYRLSGVPGTAFTFGDPGVGASVCEGR